jgi:DNA-binding NarL/FixJ family response regulator
LPAQKAARILLATDFPILRSSLKSHFEQVPGIEVVGCATSPDEVLSLLHSLEPRLIILDLNIEWDAFCSLLDCINATSSVRTLIMSDGLESSRVIEALRRGAHGVVHRRTSLDLLTKCIHTVLDGGFWVSRDLVAEFVHVIRECRLAAAERATRVSGAASPEERAPGEDAGRLGLTPQQTRILSAIAQRRLPRDIAATLGISEQALKEHLTDIYDKLGVYENLELVLFGWIDQQLA